MSDAQTPGPGQESVWDYPRPPRVEDFAGRIRVVFNETTVVDSVRAKRVLETSHPPVYYVPPEDILPGALERVTGQSWCEWKGRAQYFDVVSGTARAPRSAWTYPTTTPPFAELAGWVAFFAGPMDACYVNDELARPQPGGFYGGWITNQIVGPFKGAPGTEGW
jgi:uncharacterized protein (DUF427 family)